MKMYKYATTDDPPCVMIHPLQMKITIFCCFFRSPMKGIFGYLMRIAKACCDLVLVNCFAYNLQFYLLFVAAQNLQGNHYD